MERSDGKNSLVGLQRECWLALGRGQGGLAACAQRRRRDPFSELDGSQACGVAAEATVMGRPSGRFSGCRTRKLGVCSCRASGDAELPGNGRAEGTASTLAGEVWDQEP